MWVAGIIPVPLCPRKGRFIVTQPVTHIIASAIWAARFTAQP